MPMMCVDDERGCMMHDDERGWARMLMLLPDDGDGDGGGGGDDDDDVDDDEHRVVLLLWRVVDVETLYLIIMFCTPICLSICLWA